MQKKIKIKTEKILTKRAILDWILIACSPTMTPEKRAC
jgi:hypothetical protein